MVSVLARPHRRAGAETIYLRDMCVFARIQASVSVFFRAAPAGARGLPRASGIRIWRCHPIAAITHQLNEEITAPQVRLIGEDGNQLGVMTGEEAMRIAEEKEYDLVMINPSANPPVCKIMDYGKYRFEQVKKEKEARKNQHVVEVKEIRMSPSIGDNDFQVKLRSGQKFLQEGNRLKVTVRFRGRQMAHTDLGRALLERFAAQCADIATLDKGAKLEGRQMTEFLSPKPQAPAKKQQEKAKEI